jgi:hypothetical protein
MKIYLILALTIISCSLQAQRKKKTAAAQSDTLALYKALVHKSSQLQQLPLYLEMELVKSTNFITAAEDTMRMQATFYIKPGISYVQFGDAEQLVNDSMALMVSDKLQRMILYRNVQPLLQRMRMVTGLQYTDSSLQEMAKRFSINGEAPASIVLSSRDLLYGTSLPKESQELQYDATSGEPVKVITLKRTLLPMSQEDYKTLTDQNWAKDKLLTIEGKGQYLIREQTSTFIYRKMAHNASMVIPVNISDRIIQDKEGAFTPVKGYEHYAFTLN